MEKENKLIMEEYFCIKCGDVIKIELENDEENVRIICDKCGIKMYKIKKGILNLGE